MEPNQKKLEEISKEKTLVLIKPEGVMRQIVGELISRFEKKGLKIVGLKMVWADEEMAAKHYTDSEEWLLDTGTKTYEGYKEKGITPPLEPRELGLNTRRKLIEHITAGPVIAMVLQGAHVIETVRKMRGTTNPVKADVGTVGFDFTLESYELSDAGDWAIKNILHASDSVENANSEISIWFNNSEVFDYTTAIEHLLYSKDWQQHDKRSKK
ncbi:MAG: nucleoside-diphosphate kinase [Candidatus Saccharimonadales bacterium]